MPRNVVEPMQPPRLMDRQRAPLPVASGEARQLLSSTPLQI